MSDELEQAPEPADEAPALDVPDEASAPPVGAGVAGAPSGGDAASVSTLLASGRRLLETVQRLPRRRRALALVVVVVVVGIVVVGVRAWADRDTGRPGWARSPESAVRGYLTSVAEGRADDALAYLADPPADRTFLTDQVLAESHKLAPMTGITIGDVRNRNETPVTVEAGFRLGGDAQTIRLEVSRDGDYWFVHGAPSELELRSDQGRVSDLGVPLLVNGVPLPPGTSQATLFPGRYRVTSDHPFVQLDTQTTVDGRPYRTGHVEVEPRLNDDGRRAVAEAARAQLETCLAQSTWTTDCDFFRHNHFAPGEPVASGTLSWTLTSGDVDLPQPDPVLVAESFRPGMHRTGLSGTAVPIEVYLRCTWTDVAGRQHSQDIEPPLNYYVADATDPDHIVITFVHVY